MIIANACSGLAANTIMLSCKILHAISVDEMRLQFKKTQSHCGLFQSMVDCKSKLISTVNEEITCITLFILEMLLQKYLLLVNVNFYCFNWNKNVFWLNRFHIISNKIKGINKINKSLMPSWNKSLMIFKGIFIFQEESLLLHIFISYAYLFYIVHYKSIKKKIHLYQGLNAG